VAREVKIAADIHCALNADTEEGQPLDMTSTHVASSAYRSNACWAHQKKRGTPTGPAARVVKTRLLLPAIPASAATTAATAATIAAPATTAESATAPTAAAARTA